MPSFPRRDNGRTQPPPTAWGTDFVKPSNFDGTQSFLKTATLLAVGCSELLSALIGVFVMIYLVFK
jgi:hypothetical protein